MVRYRNNTRSGKNNGLLMRLLGYALTTFIIPFVISFILDMLRKKLSNQERLLCNKCHGKLQVIDKGNFYCKNCKIIKFDHD